MVTEIPNHILRAILFFVLLLTIFSLGLYLGGKCIYNKYLHEVQELRQELNKNHNSAIIISDEVAQKIGFEPRSQDLDISRHSREGRREQVTITQWLAEILE